jgi:xanthine/CO dehydrogenase XdhC/CoxF family maturation factor
MKSYRILLQPLRKSKLAEKTAAIATLVKAQGSTYRRPGARMLMTSEEQMVGSLSGGCLEGDVLSRLKRS